MRRNAAKALAPIRDEFREAHKDVLDGERKVSTASPSDAASSNTQTTTSPCQ